MNGDLTWQLAVYHFGISLFGWLLAILVGGMVGALLSSLLRGWVARFRWFPTYLAVFPWRAMTALFALVLSRSGWMSWQFGLGFPVDALTIAVLLAIFLIPSVMQTGLRAAYPLSPFTKLVSYARTMAVLAIALPVFLNHGLGNFIERAYALNDGQSVLQGYLMVGLMMLAVDCIFGFAQAYKARRKNPVLSTS
jgi:ABC-type proline/glycine betaine transport system permease subunit